MAERAAVLAGVVLLALALAAQSGRPAPQAREVEPITPVPPPPPLDPARLKLGEALFRDTRLSGTGARACISCHDLASNGADGRRRALALDGAPLAVNTLSVFNAALSFRYNWAGNRRTLEEQAAGSITNPKAMGGQLDVAVARMRADPSTVAAFRRAYGAPPNAPRLLDAIATFERSLLTPNSRFDAWLRGDDKALNATELRGYREFKAAGCVACHQGVNIGGNLFQQSGVFHPLASPSPGVLRVPSLRNVAATAPYFHDGSARTLEGAVRAMGRAQLNRTLSESQVCDIVAFLRTLNGERQGRQVTAHP
jgi:cytochrome c peroxidase